MSPLFLRNCRAVIVLAILLVFLGFFHIVRTSDSVAVFPKIGFSFANTVITTDEVLSRWNSRNSFRADPQLENIVNQLEQRGEISR